ncbi:contact-dependent growth inhibition system immunity protein [Pasteurella multocida]|uniref:contact-dependent growth inhibition system immunity protein n=1 Tax=Pasteurella multocida TaxID=747 RepID=UPI00287981F7|nr:contact-dependent growth inhibition system immunity protein [Pasteurella multocida]WRK08106.1 contact-dependent growth inhibition system immunity protein [Pasteurella multocida]HDR1043956.1 CdiI family contact-dependent growth inhibition immunity protein [Pasteurella multocida]HDX1179204.1 CdiI family contact-dependent growth inhibition immunity protein [Pasteurella multocida]HEA3275790.1 CdiI family contact-dependent growth inhibition immunity protein [Pasteurella multocida]
MTEHNVIVKRTDKFILVNYFLEGVLSVLDPKQDINLLSPNITYSALGKYIRENLSKSRKIDFDELRAIMTLDSDDTFLKYLEQKIKEEFSYKNKKEIYKNMDFLSVRIMNNKIIITPHHQDCLNGYTAIEDENRKWVRFEYPIDISDEELGKVVMEGFKYCTSIYKKK